jgi:hypothetical protein
MQCRRLSFWSGRVEENGNGTAAKEGLADVSSPCSSGDNVNQGRLDQCLVGAEQAMEQAERLRYRDEEPPPSVWIPQGIDYQQGCWVFIVHLYEEGSIYAGLN